MTSRHTTSFLPLARDGAPQPLGERVFTWVWGAIQWPWLLRSLSGGPRARRAALLAELGLAADALPHLGSWKADAAFLQRIAAHVRQRRPAVVVELGIGASSLVAAQALQLWSPGGRLVGYDQHETFVEATRAWLADHGLTADFRTAPLAPAPGGWPGRWYALEDLPERIDMLIIDGPTWTIHPFVRGAAETLFPRLAPGGVVLLDDAARPGERVVARCWRRRWPGIDFRLHTDGTKGALEGVARG